MFKWWYEQHSSDHVARVAKNPKVKNIKIKIGSNLQTLKCLSSYDELRHSDDEPFDQY